MTDPQSGGEPPGQPQKGWGAQQGWNAQGFPPSPAPPPQAPKPGVIPLRPLGVGEILEGALTYIRVNPLLALGLSAAVITASQVVQVPAQLLYTDGLRRLDASGTPTITEVASAMGRGATLGLLSGAVQFVAGTVLTGLLIVVLSRAVLGRPADLGSTWATLRYRTPGLLGLGLLTALLLLAPLVVGTVPAVLLAAGGAPTGLTVLARVLLVSAAVCLSVHLWVALVTAAPAYILEEIGVLAALSRSRQLVRGSWWRVFGVLLLGTVLAGLVAGMIAIPFGVGGVVLAAVGTIIAGTVTQPFVAGITGLLYVDQRIRREGWDRDLTAAAFGTGTTDPRR